MIFSKNYCKNGKEGLAMRRQRWVRWWAIGLLAFCQLAGCAPLESKFVPESVLPEGKALVYIYRPAKTYDAGLKYYPVQANGVAVVRMFAGGYFPYYCLPGRIRFAARGEHTATLTTDIAAGKTYYLKLHLVKGTGMGTPAFEMVAPETGIADLVDCRLIVENDEAGF
jgi:hypothetical protein